MSVCLLRNLFQEFDQTREQNAERFQSSFVFFFIPEDHISRI